MALGLVFGMSFGTAFVVKENKVNNAQAWVGIGYIASKKGATAEEALIIGTVGVYESTLQGLAWGAAFGSVPGAVAGAVVGL